MLTFLGWLAETLGLGAFKLWLASRKSTAEQLGQAETNADIAKRAANTLFREQQAAEQAPVSNEAMSALLKAGKLAVALLLLSSCASAHGTAYGCLPVREWSVVDQQNAAADLETLPPNSTVLDMMRDYARMRDMARACSEG